MIPVLFKPKEKEITYQDICDEIKGTNHLTKKSQKKHMKYVENYLAKTAVKFDKGRMFFVWEKIDPEQNYALFKVSIMSKGQCVFDRDFDPTNPQEFFIFRKDMEPIKKILNDRLVELKQIRSNLSINTNN